MSSSKRLFLTIAFLLCAGRASATVTFALVNSATTGAENSSNQQVFTTGPFSLTSGNLVVCYFRIGGGTSYPGGNPWSDVAGNSWTSLNDTSAYTSVATTVLGYSFTTTGSGSETVSFDLGSSHQYGAMYCGQYSVSGGTWGGIDATNSGNGCNGGCGGTYTSGTLTTAHANALIVGAATSYGGQTFSSGTIGGTTVAGSYSNNTAGNQDGVTQYLGVNSIQTSITSVSSSPQSNPWTATILSFYATPSAASCKPTLTLLGAGPC